MIVDGNRSIFEFKAGGDMRFLYLVVFGMSVSIVVNTFAAELAVPKEGSAKPAAVAPPPLSNQRTPLVKRVGPVVGGMLEDGRDVPERFRGKTVSEKNGGPPAEKQGDTLK